MYIREVQDVTGKLLKDPKIQKDHAPNLKRVWDSKEASQLFKLLEVVERFAIHAMLKAIEETGGEFVPGEIIFDGILVRHKDGGDPGSWDEVLAARPEHTTRAHVHDMHTTCTRHIHNMYTTYTQHVHDIYTICQCTRHIHDIYTTCTRHVHEA